MSQDTFVNHRGFLWFWVVFLGLLVLTGWYLLDQPIGGRSGSTVFGYTSGTISAAAILLLSWFGIRKRSYRAHRVTLKGWLALHIWLGLGLLIIVPLHAAFEFDFNVHTYAYISLCIVVISGMIGTYFYRALPIETISNRGGGALEKRYKEIEICDKQIADAIAQNSVQALTSRYNNIKKLFDIALSKSFYSYLISQKVAELDPKLASEQFGDLNPEQRKLAVNFLAIVANKRSLVKSIAKEKAVLFKLRLWLFFHIPFSLLLLVLLFVHIFSVFYFS